MFLGGGGGDVHKKCNLIFVCNHSIIQLGFKREKNNGYCFVSLSEHVQSCVFSALLC
jgi:hypothetical protein